MCVAGKATPLQVPNSAHAGGIGAGGAKIKYVFKFFSCEMICKVQLMANDNGISRVSQLVSIILGLILIIG